MLPLVSQVFEVELIDWRSVKDIAGDGGVIKTIVKEGSGWAKPLPRDEVRVRCAVLRCGRMPQHSHCQAGGGVGCWAKPCKSCSSWVE